MNRAKFGITCVLTMLPAIILIQLGHVIVAEGTYRLTSEEMATLIGGCTDVCALTSTCDTWPSESGCAYWDGKKSDCEGSTITVQYNGLRSYYCYSTENPEDWCSTCAADLCAYTYGCSYNPAEGKCVETGSSQEVWATTGCDDKNGHYGAS